MKMTFRFPFKTSFGHLQDVLGRCLACLRKISLRHLVDVFLPAGFPLNLGLVSSMITFPLWYNFRRSRQQSHGDAMSMGNSLELSSTLVRFYQLQPEQ